jgi:hypothetical protein
MYLTPSMSPNRSEDVTDRGTDSGRATGYVPPRSRSSETEGDGMDANAKEGRRARGWWAVVPPAAAALALAGCESIREYSGDAEGPDCGPNGCAAAVDAQNLCTWRHITRYNQPRLGEQGSGRNVVLCDHRRQVWATCNIIVRSHGGAVGANRTHGTQGCQAYYAPPVQIRVTGSIADVWLRLDNPSREWKRGFRGANCGISENSNGQSILHCQSRDGDAE